MIRKITWGDTVRVIDDAPSEYRPAPQGAVSGFRHVNEEIDSSRQTLVLVEFSDGNAIEIPEIFLVSDESD